MSADTDCAKVRAQLMDFLKQELPADLAAEVRQHLGDCPPCEDCAAYEQRFVALLQVRLRSAECPSSVRDRVLAALRDASPPS
ncbi:MAG: zf-HC2 domain-containing protein [Gemmatimonadota bacterium]